MPQTNLLQNISKHFQNIFHKRYTIQHGNTRLNIVHRFKSLKRFFFIFVSYNHNVAGSIQGQVKGQDFFTTAIQLKKNHHTYIRTKKHNQTKNNLLPPLSPISKLWLSIVPSARSYSPFP